MSKKYAYHKRNFSLSRPKVACSITVWSPHTYSQTEKKSYYVSLNTFLGALCSMHSMIPAAFHPPPPPRRLYRRRVRIHSANTGSLSHDNGWRYNTILKLDQPPFVFFEQRKWVDMNETQAAGWNVWLSREPRMFYISSNGNNVRMVPASNMYFYLPSGHQFKSKPLSWLEKND